MAATIKPSYDTKRRRLAEIVPLKGPFTIFIEPTRCCNFKCFFCMHATRGNPDGVLAKSGYEMKHMDFEFYEKLLAQLAEFPEHPKRIVFSGLGEPLLNPRLPEMIARAKKMELAGRLDILTNASLLTPELTDALIAAGTTRIQVSLEGLDSAKYKEVTGVDVDFDKIYQNLGYLYKHKANCSLFVKIIDSLVEAPGEKERFYKMFGPICDQMFIEHLITLQHPMGDHGGRANNTRNLNNEEVIPRDICPVIFYLLEIDVDGNVFPCPISGLPKHFSMGNMNKNTLLEIWNSSRRKGLLRAQLMRKRSKLPVCCECHACSAVLDENENMDNDAERLLPLFFNNKRSAQCPPR
ncbi:MAG: radical SAM protein [Lentisphaerae bacterium GWF2_52_8]|nr:MAG: radical SAM protein [Lentisphaerae bacterium GWF2_52_8]